MSTEKTPNAAPRFGIGEPDNVKDNRAEYPATNPNRCTGSGSSDCYTAVAMSKNIGTLRERSEKLRDAIEFVERRCEPDADCRLCGGKGRYKTVNNPNWETVFRCECTMVTRKVK